MLNISPWAKSFSPLFIFPTTLSFSRARTHEYNKNENEFDKYWVEAAAVVDFIQRDILFTQYPRADVLSGILEVAKPALLLARTKAHVDDDGSVVCSSLAPSSGSENTKQHTLVTFACEGFASVKTVELARAFSSLLTTSGQKLTDGRPES